MRIKVGNYDEYGWRTRIYSRGSDTEVIIQKHSKINPQYDHEVYLEGNDLEMVKTFLRGCKGRQK